MAGGAKRETSKEKKRGKGRAEARLRGMRIRGDSDDVEGLITGEKCRGRGMRRRRARVPSLSPWRANGSGVWRDEAEDSLQRDFLGSDEKPNSSSPKGYRSREALPRCTAQ